MGNVVARKTVIDDYFRDTDIDKTGAVTFENLRCFYNRKNRNLSDEQIRKWIEKADCNGDGKVSPQEFFKSWIQIFG